VEEERLGLRQILLDVDTWLKKVGSYVAPDGSKPFSDQQLDTDAEKIQDLLNRATSSLLTVAFAGEMSSGKSFLVSALHHQLKYDLILDEKNRPAGKYTGILPSFTEPTSACPVRVEPVASSDGTVPPVVLSVRFAESEEWEWIADNPTAQTVAAYLTDIPERIEKRKENHRNRIVAEARLLVPATDMPSILYDLPGLNAPGRRYEMIARKAWNRADCIVYVTPATHTLRDSETELIAEIYKHYKGSAGRKKIIWAVTAIDTALDVTADNLARWRSTARRNTEYIRDLVQSTGDVDPDFAGRGFIGVSPALEARAEFGGTRSAFGSAEDDMSDSRMDELRHALLAMINEGAGAQHLANVALGALPIVRPYERTLRDILLSAKIPHEHLQDEISELERRISQLRSIPAEIRQEFGERLKTDIQRIVLTFNERHGLAKHLHDELDPYIKSANLLSQLEVSQLDLRMTRLIREWIERDPLQRWIHELRQLAERLRLRVASALSHSHADNSLSYNELDLELFSPSRTPRTPAQQSDLAEKAASIVTATFSLAGAAATAIGTLLAVPATGVAAAAGVTAATTLGLALAPVGVVMLTTGIYVFRRRRQQRISSLEVMRQEHIEALDTQVVEAAAWFTKSTLEIGDDLIEKTAERIEVHIEELREMIRRRTERLDTPEVLEEREHIEMLTDMCDRAGMIRGGLERCAAFSGATLDYRT